MMRAVWIRAKYELRAYGRGWLAITLMVMLACGVVMAAAEGARRSATAVDRFLAYAGATHADVQVLPSQYHEIAALPEVESATAAAYMLMGNSLQSQVLNRVPVSVLALTDPVLHPRAIVVAGRLFDLGNPAQAMMDESALRSGALHVGQTVTMRGYSPNQMDQVLAGSREAPQGPQATVTIVGVMHLPTDLSTTNPPPGVIYTGNADLFLTPALYARIGGATANFPGLAVRLRRGNADLPRLTADVARLTHGKGAVQAGSDDLQAGREADRATRTESLSLWLFGGFAGVAALLIIGQSLSRQIFIAAGDNDRLLALGMSRTQLICVGLICALVVAVAGGLLGAMVAVLLSPLTPIGLAREAEVDIGFHLDLLVLGIGVAASVVLLCARASFSAWRASRPERDERLRRPRRVADAAARAGMPAASVAGVRMALDPGRGRSSVPVRTAIAGTVVAVAVLSAAVAFGASLDRLSSTPALQGWTWDVAVGNPHSADVRAHAVSLLRASPYVGGFTSLEFNDVKVVGAGDLTVVGLDQVLGAVGPPVLDGRAPNGPDEIALGSKVLDRLKKRVGDSILVEGQTGKRAAVRIVGRALITPVIVNDQITVGDGGWMEQSALQTFDAPGPSDQGAVNVFLVKLKPGVDRQAALASLRREFPGTVLTPYAPAEIENLRRIDSLPYLLAGLLGLLAAATIAHALVTSVRRRRHDLAILKTLGFIRRQVSAAVAWQASTLTILAALIGLAAGVIGGRWLWIYYSSTLGVRPEPAIPLLLLVIVVPGALVLGNLIAAMPARAAARTEPALVLRTE